MPLDIQRDLYLVCVRIAFIYGMKMLPFKATHYEAIDRIQRSFATMILGCGQRACSKTVRVVLGLPKLSEFLRKLKLSMYYDVMMQRENTFAATLRANYMELLGKYRKNGNTLKGLKNQWLYDTADWIRCIDDWDLPEIYKDPLWLPGSRKEWQSVLRRKWKALWREDLEDVLSGNGSVFWIIFGIRHLRRKYASKPWSGFLDELRLLYSDRMSTKGIAKSIRMLINNTAASYLTASAGDRVIGPIVNGARVHGLICPMCYAPRSEIAAFHLAFKCDAVTSEFGKIDEKQDYRLTVRFLEGLQSKIGELSLP